MPLHPAHSPSPSTWRTDRLLLRPLRTTDVALDYDAVMASAEQLRMWSDSTWPEDDFTLAGNLADLQLHQDEHEAGVAYTYTVLTPGGDRCLGCVYLTALPPQMQPACAGATAPVAVRFWVRTEEIADDLDRRLLGALREWLRREWFFDCVVYPLNPLNTRQAVLLEEAGCMLRLAYLRNDGQPWHVYG
jgi:RimJ/RimL family protein N-acetyltransferase